MSRLEELIQELCPEGVEFKPLGDITSAINIGINPRKFFKLNPPNATGFYVTVRELNGLAGVKQHDKTDLIDANAINVINGRANIEIGDILFSNTGTVGKLALVNEPPINWGVNEGIYVIKPLADLINSRFLFYCLSCAGVVRQYKAMFTGSTLKHVTQKSLAQIMIPVPPMEVQSEIFRILDNFTDLTEKLEEQLTEELTARKQQYEYYRDVLLTFDRRGGATSDIEWRKLGEVILSLNTGLNPRRFFKLNTEGAENYYVTIRELKNNKVVFNENTDRINDEALRLCNNRSNLEVGDILFSGTGTIGEVAMVESKPINWNIKEGVYSIKPNPKFLDSKFLMYLLCTNQIRSAFLKKAEGGTVKSVSMGEMRKLLIPVPDIEKQRHIVLILERFDMLCNDSSLGLQAELKARQKQYEYYRDKLLTFKEKPA